MIVDLVIVSLSLGFAVISWVISSQAYDYDDKPVSNPVKSIEASKETMSILDKIKSQDVVKPADDIVVAIPEIEEEKAPANKKKVTKTKKVETVKVECPGCSATMKVPKTGKMQNITCSECGLSGELEI